MAVTKPNIIWKGAAAGNFWPNREGFKIKQITMHHVVGDAHHAFNRALTPGQQFSPHFTIGMDGTIFQCVQLDHMAYTDNDIDSNRRAVTIEHAGGKEGFPYTDPMYKSSAHLVAWLLQEYGDLEIKRHRDVVSGKKATACPGGLDVERILREARQLKEGEPMANAGWVREQMYHLFAPRLARTVEEQRLRPGTDLITDEMIAPYLGMTTEQASRTMMALGERNTVLASIYAIANGDPRIDRVATTVIALREKAGELSHDEAVKELEALKKALEDVLDNDN